MKNENTIGFTHVSFFAYWRNLSKFVRLHGIYEHEFFKYDFFKYEYAFLLHV